MERPDEEDNHEFLSIADSAKELRINIDMIHKYIERGLQFVTDEKGNISIPKAVIDSWKDPVKAFQLQWLYQVEKAQAQSDSEYLESLNRQIAEFENEYHGTYQELFEELSDFEIDGMPDIFDWKELEHQKGRLITRLNE